MDFSGFTNFDDIPDEKPEEPKPKIIIRNSKIRLTTHSAINKKSYSFYHPCESLHENSQVYNHNYFRKIPKKPGTYLHSSQALFFAFEGNKVSLSSLRDYKDIHSNEVSPTIKPTAYPKPFSLRTKKKNFRRLKWTPLRIRANTSLVNPEKKISEETVIKRLDRKARVFKRELIPQTKASLSVRSKRSIPELRISGVMKDFACRDFFSPKAKESFITDFY